jgi:hypothetical protein
MTTAVANRRRSACARTCRCLVAIEDEFILDAGMNLERSRGYYIRLRRIPMLSGCSASLAPDGQFHCVRRAVMPRRRATDTIPGAIYVRSRCLAKRSHYQSAGSYGPARPVVQDRVETNRARLGKMLEKILGESNQHLRQLRAEAGILPPPDCPRDRLRLNWHRRIRFMADCHAR